MKSADQFTNIHRRIMALYERGHTLDTEQLERAIDGLIGATIQMVQTRNAEETQQPGTAEQKENNPPIRNPPKTTITA
jgi:hypothetical protein